jgi:hypothetical protein
MSHHHTPLYFEVIIISFLLGRFSDEFYNYA